MKKDRIEYKKLSPVMIAGKRYIPVVVSGKGFENKGGNAKLRAMAKATGLLTPPKQLAQVMSESSYFTVNLKCLRCGGSNEPYCVVMHEPIKKMMRVGPYDDAKKGAIRKWVFIVRDSKPALVHADGNHFWFGEYQEHHQNTCDYGWWPTDKFIFLAPKKSEK